jgi:hypothetical protein
MDMTIDPLYQIKGRGDALHLHLSVVLLLLVILPS